MHTSVLIPLRATFAVLALLLLTPQLLQAADFNLPAQALGKALHALGEKTNVNVLFDPQAVKGREAPAVQGATTVDEALTRLLDGSDLTFRYLDEKTVTIVRRAAASTRSDGAPADQMRLAVIAAEEAKKMQESTARDAKTGADVLVEGVRERPAPFSSANLDLTRTEDDVLPFMILTAQDIHFSGASDLQDFLQRRLPQNFNPDIPDELDGGATSQMDRQNRIDMRGWGAEETVILVNGRPMGAQYQNASSPGTFSTQTNDQQSFNLRGIPLASIERIEILASAGSAIYGTGATGGVINIITRQDFRGGQVAVNYQSPSDVHRPTRGLDISYGMPLRWGLGLRGMASYSEREPLRASDRAAVSSDRWRRLVMERQPTRLINQSGGNPFNSTSTVYGATPNIRATSSSGNLFSGLPGAQASNYTTVPDGYTGSGELADFQPGVWNLEQAQGAAGGNLYAGDSTLGTVNRNTMFSVGLDKQLAAQWRWSVDYRYMDSTSVGNNDATLALTSSSQTSTRPRVPAAAPGNPFGQDVYVRLVDPMLNRSELMNQPENVTWELSSTLRGKIGAWTGFLDLNYTQNKSAHVTNVFVEPIGGWYDALLTGAYDPFVDLRVAAPASADFYAHYVQQRTTVDNAMRNYQAAIKASGPVFRLPGGEVQLTAGLSWSRADRYRNEGYVEFLDSLTGELRTPVGSDIDYTIDQSLSRRFLFDAYAGYAEFNAPLLSPEQDIPLVQRLELFGSGRLDFTERNGFRSDFLGADPVKYSHRSQLHAYGLRYEMLEGLSFRVSQSIGFKPPTLAQVTPDNPPTFSTSGLNDPIRDEALTLTPTMYQTGGNPDVGPETTDSLNIGLILSPRWMPGLRLSVSYLESTRDDAIFSLGAQDAINLELDLPGVVQRGAPDGHASGVGPITFVDRRAINLRQVSSRSMDFSVQQEIQNMAGGRLILSAVASRNISFKVQATNSGPAEEQVRSLTGAFGRQIEWNGNAQVRWEGQQWGFGWSTRYLDYILVQTTYLLLQGADRAPRALEHDLNVSYRASSAGGAGRLQWLLEGTSVNFGVRNVFNREPRFWAASTDRGVAPFDSITGRSIWMQMRKDFN